MRRWMPLLAATLLLLLFLGGTAQITPRGYTQLQLTDADTGRKLLSATLANNEALTLTWRNSIFQLPVIEVFYAAEGAMVLDQVTFVDPQGIYQMPVTPADVTDLYHTGGPFATSGLARPYHQVIFRIGEIGDPRIAVQGQMVALKQEVGFGGRVRLDARRANALEVIRQLVAQTL